MSHPNTERDERVSRPRQIWLTEFTDNQDPRFILADWRTREVRNTQPGDFVAIRPHHKLEYVPVQAVNDAATRMRDRCVERVSSLADEWLKQSIEDKNAERSRSLRLSYNVAQNIITELESVALNGQERSAQGAGIQRCLRQVKMMLVNWQDGMRWPHQGDLLDEVISRLESLMLEHCSGPRGDKP